MNFWLKLLKKFDTGWIKYGKHFWDTIFIETNEKGEDISVVFTNRSNVEMISKLRDMGFKEFRK